MANLTLQSKELRKEYPTESGALRVVNDITFDVFEKEFISITGASGSGKSTLLGLLAVLDRPTSGQVLFKEQVISELSENDVSRLRAQSMGFVFQNFHLIPTLTALENVLVPIELAGGSDNLDAAMHWLQQVGLEDRVNHYPTQLSGGEMQRVALARAAVARPELLFADEPTGNLDSKNGDSIMALLEELNNDCTIVLVTHNKDLASMADREFVLQDGNLVDIKEHRAVIAQ
jgi:putative ABC transport system ATP-binding protein